MTFYSKLTATTLRLLKKFGQPLVLRPYSIGGGDYDPVTGVATPDGMTGQYDETRQCLPTDQPGSQIAQRFGQTLQDGSLVQSADKWVYMDGVGRAPTLQDRILLQGVEYAIINVQVTDPGGVAVLYLMVLRA